MERLKTSLVETAKEADKGLGAAHRTMTVYHTMMTDGRKTNEGEVKKPSFKTPHKLSEALAQLRRVGKKIDLWRHLEWIDERAIADRTRPLMIRIGTAQTGYLNRAIPST